MQDFLDYLASIIIIPIIIVIILVGLDIMVKAPMMFKIIAYIVGFILLTYLIPYFLRAFIWSLIPGYVIALALDEYKIIPGLAFENVGLLPPTKEVLIISLVLAGIIQIMSRSYFVKEDENDPCVPFARNRQESNKRKSKSYVMAQNKKNPIGFIWDEEDKR